MSLQWQAGGGVSPRQIGGLVGSGVMGVGSRMFPALDYLATSLIGDNPALTGALRCVGLAACACFDTVIRRA